MPPLFKPYPLTPLDHMVPPMYLFQRYDFDLPQGRREKALECLQRASSRLLELLSFLAGNVIPLESGEGKKNTFGVQPPHNIDALTPPMLVVQHHPPDRQILRDGDFDPAFLPLSPIASPDIPCPILRIKANFVGEKLVLVLGQHHMVMDGMGCVLMQYTFARLCRDPSALLDQYRYISKPSNQSNMHQQMLSLRRDSLPRPIPWTTVDLGSLDIGSSIIELEPPISYKPYMSAERFRILESICGRLIESLAHRVPGSAKIPSSMLLIAALGVCCTRARGAEPGKVTTPVDIRQRLGFPPTYMGNALNMVESSTDVTVFPVDPTDLASLDVPNGLVKEDVMAICNVALCMSWGLERLDGDAVRGIVSEMANREDWGSYVPACDMVISDLRRMDFYLDFGLLGVVQDQGVFPGVHGGVCWVSQPKPAQRQRGSAEVWELQIVLERSAVERLKQDELFQWLTDIKSVNAPRGHL